MRVQEIYNEKPTRRICDFRNGEVFKYAGEWFIAVDISLDNIHNGWTEVTADNIHNPLDEDWNEYELTSCVMLENGTFCFLGDRWVAEDYGDAELRIQLKS